MPQYGSAGLCTSSHLLAQVCLTRRNCEKCSVTAYYGLPGERARFCVTHRTEGMVGAWTCSCVHTKPLPSQLFQAAAAAFSTQPACLHRCAWSRSRVQRRPARAGHTSTSLAAGEHCSARNTLRLAWYACLLCARILLCLYLYCIFWLCWVYQVPLLRCPHPPTLSLLYRWTLRIHAAKMLAAIRPQLVATRTA